MQNSKLCGLGGLQIKVKTQPSIINWKARTEGFAPGIRLREKTAIIDTIDRVFDYFEIALLVRQSVIIGPNVGCDKSQLCSCADDFEKQNAAKIKNGTVGRRVRTTTNDPRANAKKPNKIQSTRTVNSPISCQ